MWLGLFVVYQGFQQTQFIRQFAQAMHLDRATAGSEYTYYTIFFKSCQGVYKLSSGSLY